MSHYLRVGQVNVACGKATFRCNWTTHLPAVTCRACTIAAKAQCLADALEYINRRASPSPGRTLGECADELVWIADEARAALAEWSAKR